MTVVDPYEGTTLKTTSNVVDFTLKVECERIYGQYLTDRCTKGAFLGSASTLESVTFPSGSQLKEIQECAFYSCSKLSAIDFSNCELLTTIGQYAFSGCTTLSNVILPKFLSTITPYCFHSCNIKTISIPKTVKAFQSACFQGNQFLTQVDIPSDSLLERIEWRSFRGTGLISLFIPRYVNFLAGSVFEAMTSLTRIDCDVSNEHFSSSAGILYNKAQTEIVRYPGGYSNTFTVPDNVERIAAASFSRSILESITFNTKVNFIGSFAFSENNLVSIVIPDCITEIQNNAFQYNLRLKSITFGSGLKNYQLNVLKALLLQV